jgi:hypothetical protein
MSMTELLIAPRLPWQNTSVERVPGSIRREGLGHFIILTSAIFGASLPLTRATSTEPAPTYLDQDGPYARPIQPLPRQGAMDRPYVRSGGLICADCLSSRLRTESAVCLWVRSDFGSAIIDQHVIWRMAFVSLAS